MSHCINSQQRKCNRGSYHQPITSPRHELPPSDAGGGFSLVNSSELFLDPSPSPFSPILPSS